MSPYRVLLAVVIGVELALVLTVGFAPLEMPMPPHLRPCNSKDKPAAEADLTRSSRSVRIEQMFDRRVTPPDSLRGYVAAADSIVVGTITRQDFRLDTCGLPATLSTVRVATVIKGGVLISPGKTILLRRHGGALRNARGEIIEFRNSDFPPPTTGATYVLFVHRVNFETWRYGQPWTERVWSIFEPSVVRVAANGRELIPEGQTGALGAAVSGVSLPEFVERLRALVNRAGETDGESGRP